MKVPKEICVNTKKNPRRVKKPVVKEWCYRPRDLVENPESFPTGLLDNDDDDGGDGDGGDGGDASDSQDEEAASTPRRRN